MDDDDFDDLDDDDDDDDGSDDDVRPFPFSFPFSLCTVSPRKLIVQVIFLSIRNRTWISLRGSVDRPKDVVEVSIPMSIRKSVSNSDESFFALWVLWI
jgi:hypothetical protein